MKSNRREATQDAGRWIRPAREPGIPGALRAPGPQDLDAFAGQLLREARQRVSSLAALEREIEDRIRLRWEETEAEVRRKMAHSEEEILALRKRLDGELKDARMRAEKEGRAAGFREGFARGREEGYRLGFEEGRREGQKEGQREGREEESRRLQNELSGAAAALAEAASDLHQRKDDLLRQAKRDLIDLSLEVAKRLVKRDISMLGDTVVRNVEKAIELIFRRGSLIAQVNPEDAPVIEEALRAEPRWTEGFDAVEIRSTPEISRGGCRLVSGAGTVDMTLETQLSLIQSALESAEEDPAGEPSVEGARDPGKESLATEDGFAPRGAMP